MSTENDPTRPVPTGPADREQPTAPVPRATGDRGDDQTLVFDTFGGGDRPAEAGTAPLRRPVADRGAEPATAPLPTGGGVRTVEAPGTGAGTGPSDLASGAGADAAAPAGAGDRVDDPSTARPSLRVGTVVWGLVVALIGAGVIAVAAGARFDVELALIGLLALAGLGLVGGSVAAGMRRRR